MTTPNYWTEREPGEHPPAPWIDPRTRSRPTVIKFLAGLKELVVFLAVIGIGGVVIHDHLNPPAAVPDHLETNAKAYLFVQPSSLREVAKGIRSGAINKDKVGQAIRDAHTPAATDLQNSLAASVSLPDALDRAAAAMEKCLKGKP